MLLGFSDIRKLAGEPLAAVVEEGEIYGTQGVQ
jgi:hypothetical protein